VKVFNWTATLWRGSLSFEPPMLLRLSFCSCSPSAAFRGVMLAIVYPVDFQYNQTYFVSSLKLAQSAQPGICRSAPVMYNSPWRTQAVAICVGVCRSIQCWMALPRRSYPRARLSQNRTNQRCFLPRAA